MTSETFSSKIELTYNQAKQLKKMTKQIIFLTAKVKSSIMLALQSLDQKDLKSKPRKSIKICSEKTRSDELTILINSNLLEKENKKEI